MNGAAATDFRPQRIAIALLCGLVVLSVSPALGASAQDSGFSVILDVEDVAERSWYVSGDSLNISVSIANLGSATTLTSNPSCPAVLSAFSENGDTLWNGLEEANCRQQSRATDFASEEIKDWFDLSWNFMDTDDAFVPSGLLTIIVSIPSTNLSTEFDVLWQSPVEISPSLNFELVTAESPSGTFNSAEGLFTAILLHNSAEQEIPMFSSENCFLRLTAWQNGVVITDGLTDVECDEGADEQTLDAGELRHYPWIYWDFIGDNGMEVETGDVLVELGLPDRSIIASTIVNYTNLGLPNDESLSGHNSPLMPSLVFSKQADEDGITRTSTGDSLGFTGVLTNTGDSTVTASFDNICRIEIFIIDPDGNIVYDTRDGRDCRDMEIDHVIDTNSFFTIEHAEWPLVDRNGCGLPFGTYTAVVDVPEFRLRSSSQFVHIDDGSGVTCSAENSVSMAQNVQFDNPLVLAEDEDSLNVSISMTNGEVDLDLRWISSCRIGVEIIDIDTMSTIGGMQTWCGSKSGERIRLNPNSIIVDNEFSILMVDNAGESLEDGNYMLEIHLNSVPSTELQYEFSWPLLNETVEEEVDTENGSAEVDELDPTASIISGTWMFVTNDFGGCWILNSDGQSHLLLDATSVTSWSPKPQTMGTYSVIDDPRDAPECPGWESQIAILEVLQEESILPISETPASEVQSDVEDESVIEAVAPTIVTVVVSTSILSMLVVAIASNESLRIPITQVGLALIGLVGRTHETNDGKYQRGRLMGYLTANPGCHFRALMGALDMSNGQITHHLKVLEDDGVVWRSKDGRLMRFYPSTIDCDTPADELPIPALSPDPNSLQGKILRLLDHDGVMGTYPTQRDLADRLERSQQLISHHLRTLQKYGLIEKSRAGLKNRYKLTKEAVFLLNQPRQ